MVPNAAQHRTGQMPAPTDVPAIHGYGEALAENPRAYGFKLLLRAVKEAVPVERLADDLGAMMRRTGKEMRGRCPIHGGQNRDAFCVYPEQGSWHCFRCNEGGDVLDLYERARGYWDLKAALMDLAGEYDVERPERSPRWHARQGEKDRRHKELVRWREQRYQRRLYRLFAASSVAAIEDDNEREAEARKTWEELGGLARAWAIRSLS